MIVHPVVLGGGKRMFSPMESAIRLHLVERRTLGSQVVLLRYERLEEG